MDERKPFTPADLAGALQDRVHGDLKHYRTPQTAKPSREAPLMQVGDRVRYADSYLQYVATKCMITPRSKAMTGHIFCVLSPDEVIVEWADCFHSPINPKHLTIMQ